MWMFLSLLMAAIAIFGHWTNTAVADYEKKRWSDVRGLDVAAARGVADSVTEGFFVTADVDGEEMPIATAGPFEIFARCTVGANDEIAVIVKSTVAGWREPFITRALDAGEERVVFFESAKGDEPTYENSASRFTALGPDGNGGLIYLAIDGETLGLGLNVFDHECLAVGTVTLAELGDGAPSDRWRKRWNRRRDDHDDD